MLNNNNQNTAQKAKVSDATLLARFNCKDGAFSFVFNAEQAKSVTSDEFLEHEFNILLKACSHSFLGREPNYLSCEELKFIEKKIVELVYFNFYVCMGDYETFSEVAPSILATYKRKDPLRFKHMVDNGKIEINAENLLLLYKVNQKEAMHPINQFKQENSVENQKD